MDDLVKRLHDSQPLQANLVALAKQPKHAVKTFGAEWAGMCAASALDEIERLRKEVEALRADALRYRWLRDSQHELPSQLVMTVGGIHMDTDIDAAMKGQP